MTAPSGYNLIFSEDFNGTSLDTTNWDTIDESKENWLIGFRNYNTYLDGNGNLVNIIKVDSSGRNGITYGGVRTINSWLYGYFEVRAKVGSGQNISSAFWTTGLNWCWPPEIDICETAGYRSTPTDIYMTYHWGTDCCSTCPNFQAQNIFNSSIDLSSDYHTYGVEWTSSYIRWMFDDAEKAKIIPSSSIPMPSRAMQFIFTIGPGWVGSPSNNILPQEQYIDYFRVYQLSATPLNVSLDINPIIIDAGQPVKLVATANGGIPPYSYVWT